jgi:hypothetical protein
LLTWRRSSVRRRRNSLPGTDRTPGKSLKNSSSRLLKKFPRRGGILVIVSVKTWSRIPNQHQHANTNTN